MSQVRLGHAVALAGYFYLIVGALVTLASNWTLYARFEWINARGPGVSAYWWTVLIYAAFGLLLTRRYGIYSILHLGACAGIQDLTWNALYVVLHPWFWPFIDNPIWFLYASILIGFTVAGLAAQRSRMRWSWALPVLVAYVVVYAALGMPNQVFNGHTLTNFALELGYVVLPILTYARLVRL